MKRFSLLVITLMIVLAGMPAYAQQGPGPGAPGPMYGYGHMWPGDGWGWHSGMIFGPVLMLLALVGIVALVVWLAHAFGHGPHYGHGFCPRCGPGRGRAALDILEERLAKGEINKDEFEERRKALGR